MTARLGQKNRAWTDKEDEIVRSMWRKETTRAIGERLGRSRGSIIGRACRLGCERIDMRERLNRCNFVKRNRPASESFRFKPPKPAPKPKSVHIAPDSPAAQLAAAILEAARAAERRREGWRMRPAR